LRHHKTLSIDLHKLITLPAAYCQLPTAFYLTDYCPPPATRYAHRRVGRVSCTKKTAEDVLTVSCPLHAVVETRMQNPTTALVYQLQSILSVSEPRQYVPGSIVDPCYGLLQSITSWLTSMGPRPRPTTQAAFEAARSSLKQLRGSSLTHALRSTHLGASDSEKRSTPSGRCVTT
jgi:hypothetical protein